MPAPETDSRPARLLSPDYAVQDIETLAAPRLLIFRKLVERNFDLMKGYLEEVVPGSGFQHLASHAKTHKCQWATQLSLERGVQDFKCSLNELDMLLAAGVPRVFIAYPLLPTEADRVATAIRSHPGTKITVQVARSAQADALARAAKRHGVEFDVLLDLDVGGHRTGLQPNEAVPLARQLTSDERYRALHITGLHAYDGHNASSDQKDRDAVAVQVARTTLECRRGLLDAGIPAHRIITAGSPGFIPLLREFKKVHDTDADVLVSPGTWIYWDSNYDARMPGLFCVAAALYGRVMDLPSKGLVTLNLGHKRWSIDQGPPQYYSVPGLEFVAATEEHTVLRTSEGSPLEFNDPVLFAPRHVCPTINLWGHFSLIGPDGQIEAELPVTARNP